MSGIIVVLTTVAVWAAVGGLALRQPLPALVHRVRARPALVVRLTAWNVAAAPLAGAGLAWLLHLPQDVALGFLLVAMTSAGPFSLVSVRLAGGDLALTIGLIALLELANLIALPVWTSLLLPSAIAAPIADVALVVLALVALPVAVAAGLRRLPAAVVRRLARSVDAVGAVATVVLLVVVAISALPLLASRSGLQLVLATAGLGVVLLVGGALAAGGTRETRVTGALASMQRGNTLALAIALAAFPAQPAAASAVVGAGLTLVCLGTGVALVNRLSLRRTHLLAARA